MIDRRALLLLGTSAAAVTAVIGSGPADAQVWRFLRGKGGGGSTPPPPRPRCPPHGPIVVIGFNNRTQIPIRKCLRCGLVFIN
jgi:hypothetical protein